MATGSASSRRATKASVCAETRSSHCASSTTQTSGCSSSASASRLRTARPTRKRSGALPGAQTERDGQRVTLRAGKTIQMPHHRHTQLVQTGERQFHLGLDAGSPRELKPCRAPTRYSTNADLPTPASPRRTRT